MQSQQGAKPHNLRLMTWSLPSFVRLPPSTASKRQKPTVFFSLPQHQQPPLVTPTKRNETKYRMTSVPPKQFALSLSNPGGRQAILTNRKLHLKRLRNMKSTLDMSPPKTYMNPPPAMRKGLNISSYAAMSASSSSGMSSLRRPSSSASTSSYHGRSSMSMSMAHGRDSASNSVSGSRPSSSSRYYPSRASTPSGIFSAEARQDKFPQQIQEEEDFIHPFNNVSDSLAAAACVLPQPQQLSQGGDLSSLSPASPSIPISSVSRARTPLSGRSGKSSSRTHQHQQHGRYAERTLSPSPHFGVSSSASTAAAVASGSARPVSAPSVHMQQRRIPTAGAGGTYGYGSRNGPVRRLPLSNPSDHGALQQEHLLRSEFGFDARYLLDEQHQHYNHNYNQQHQRPKDSPNKNGKSTTAILSEAEHRIMDEWIQLLARQGSRSRMLQLGNEAYRIAHELQMLMLSTGAGLLLSTADSPSATPPVTSPVGSTPGMMTTTASSAVAAGGSNNSNGSGIAAAVPAVESSGFTTLNKDNHVPENKMAEGAETEGNPRHDAEAPSLAAAPAAPDAVQS